MDKLILYVLFLTVGISLFTIAYQVFLKSSSNYLLSRLYILSAILFSVLCPLFPIDLGLNEFIASNTIQANLQTPGIETSAITTSMIKAESNGFFDSITILQIIKILVLSISLLLFIRLIYRLAYLINLLIIEQRYIDDTGEELFYTKRTDNAFSFFGNIFINPNNFSNEEKRLIIEHEKVHISHYHSIDLIIIELLLVVQWFNPFAYLLRRSLIETHEFIADQGVISKGNDPYSYQNLLLTVISSKNLRFAGNQLSAFITKKRIAMIGKNKQPENWCRFLIILPILFVIVLVISFTSPERSINRRIDYKQFEQDTAEVEYQLLKRSIKDVQDGILKYFYIDLFPNKTVVNKVVLRSDMVYSLYYYSASKEDELITKVEISNSIGSSCLFEKKISYHHKTSFLPRLTGEYNISIQNLTGKQTNALIVLSTGTHKELMFDTSNIRYKNDSTIKSTLNEEVFTVVETMPDFPGGSGSFRKYIDENLEYPKAAAENGIQGRVFVQFVVEADGQVTNAKILRGVDPSIDKEAIRVVESSPKWNPAKQRGQAVRVSFTFPIEFSLQKEDKNKATETSDEVFTVVEDMPKFGDNDLAFRKFIVDNLKYPDEAAKAGIKGTVYVQFTITKDGDLVDPKVIRSVNKLLDEEAIRVVKLSPKWIPGKQRGQNVNVQYTMPVIFMLGENKK